jgi:hypothetical protein
MGYQTLNGVPNTALNGVPNISLTHTRGGSGEEVGRDGCGRCREMRFESACHPQGCAQRIFCRLGFRG